MGTIENKVYRGLDGVIYVSTDSEGTTYEQVGYMNNWSITVNRATSETSSFGDIWNQYISTTKDWSGTISGSFAKTEDAHQTEMINKFLTEDITGLKCKFGLDTKKGFVGDVVISSVNTTADRASAITLSINFQGTGALELYNEETETD